MAPTTQAMIRGLMTKIDTVKLQLQTLTAEVDTLQEIVTELSVVADAD